MEWFEKVTDIFNALLVMLNAMSPYLLLGFLVAGVLHAFVPPTLYARHLGGSGWGAVAKAAAFGVPLPLCSCGVLPAAVALRRAGASRAAATSFLIATPQTGVDSIAATGSLLGVPFAILRPLAALVTALAGGRLVGKFAPKEDEGATSGEAPRDERRHGFGARVGDALHYGLFEMVEHVGRWLVIGLVVAALITVWVPDDFFAAAAEWPLLNIFAVLIMAVPMYVCATGSIPIALSLMLKGLTPGAAFVLLMAGPAVNFASIMVVSRTFGRRSALLYLLSIVGGAVAFGLAIDYLLPAAWFVPMHAGICDGCHDATTWGDLLCSVVLAALLLRAWIKGRIEKYNNKHVINMSKQFKIKGMMCPHCKMTVEKGLASVAGVTAVRVDLEQGTASVEGEFDAQAVIDKIAALGYEYIG